MGCAACGAEIPDGTSGPCSRCGTPVPPADGATVLSSDTQALGATAGRPVLFGTGVLAPGTAFGGRYHVIRLLGAGGMGAVYQAWDNELGVAVALKVIRPEVMVDPEGARDLERRFKRELLLARQVTHKNVVRIHDLGEVDGIKYITMPYIQGVDLATYLHREGRLPAPKVVAIAKQVAHGLAAAHEAGVVHRDLKPANIMIDEDDRAIIMDFGIARSTSAGATMLGTVVGTLEYMAPEQALGQPVDHRADIYTFGLILYDLLLGRRSAARAESAVAELMKRMQRSLPPARSVDASIPEPLEAIIAACMQPDPAHRFQTTVELVAALESLDRDGGLADPNRPPDTRRHTRTPYPVPQNLPEAAAAAAPRAVLVTPRRIAVAAVVTVGVLFGAYAAFQSRGATPAQSQSAAAAPRTSSMAILPFRNETGDPELAWVAPAAAEMLKGAAPAPGIRVVSSDRVLQVLKDLRVAADADLDDSTVRRLAEFSSATTVLSGRYLKDGTEYRFEAVLRDVARGASEELSVRMAGPGRLMEAMATLGRAINEKLAGGAAAPVAAAAARPSTTSVEALRSYTEGVELGRAGNHLEAARRLEAATIADPSFALAHARLARTYATLGFDPKAEQASRAAVEHAAKLPERERHLIAAAHAEVINDHKRAIDAYERLLALTPNDEEIRYSLAGAYEAVGAYEQARNHYLEIVKQDPKYFEGLFALGRNEIRLKNPQAAIEHLNRALNVAIDLDNDQGRAYALNAIGVAYKQQKRPLDAQRYYSQALEIRKHIGDERGMASTLNELAQVQEDLGKPDQALESYQQSLTLRRAIADKRGTANVLNDLGSLYLTLSRLDDALDHYTEALELQTEVGNAAYEALALHNIGLTQMLLGRYADADSYLTRALKTRETLDVPAETAATLRTLGQLHLRLGAHEEALGHYLKALQLSRDANDIRGVSLAMLGTGIVYKEQGRYSAALDAMKDAAGGLRALKVSGGTLVDALAGQAHAWTLLGRHDEAAPLFNEAASTAARVPDPKVLVHVLNLRGEDALLAANTAAALTFLQQASQLAPSSKDPYLVLMSRLNMAKAQLQGGRAQAAMTVAAGVATQAGQRRLRYLATDAAVTAGEALVAMRAYSRAQATLGGALGDAERIGARALRTRAHQAMANALQAAGQPAAAATHYGEASRLLQELQKEAGVHSLAKRADLADIVTSATRRAPVSD